MTNAVFPTFQTQYILDFSSAIRCEHWDLPNTEIFQSKDVASVPFALCFPDFNLISGFFAISLCQATIAKRLRLHAHDHIHELFNKNSI
jgi:hypothetical protein